MDKQELAFCGLDCSICNLRRAAHDRTAAEALVDWFRQRGWIAPHEGADEIMEKAPFYTGCRSSEGPHFCGGCTMRSCCEEKKLNHCGECPAFPCKPYAEWTEGLAHHQAAMEQLLSLQSVSEK